MRNAMSILILGVFAFCSSVPADTKTAWNIADDFDISQNPNGQWQYGYTTSNDNLASPYGFSTLDNYGIAASGTLNGRLVRNIDGTDYPSITSNPLPVDIVAGSQIWPAHTCGFDPGAGFSNKYAMYRWTAPAAADYAISAVFWVGYLGQTNSKVYVIKNGSISGGVHLFDSTINAAANGNQDSKKYSDLLTLSAGDTIDFVVGRGQLGTYNSVLTLVGATIAQKNPCSSVFSFDWVPDCYIDFNDLAVLAQNWLNPYNFIDFNSLASAWLECFDPCNIACLPHIEKETAAAWATKAFIAPNSRLPISFKYNGTYSNNFLNSWSLQRSSEVLDPNRTKWTLVYTEPVNGRLAVTFEAIQYSDYPAIEWVVWFENRGTSNTPIIENIQSLDLMINALSSSGNFKLHAARGSFQTGGNMPAPAVGTPMDFEPLLTTFAPVMPPSALAQGPISGRSSDGGNIGSPSYGTGRMPFFNIEYPGGQKGVMLGIGWTGQWKAVFEPTTGGSLNVAAGMELTRLKLYPGEKIRTPSILMMFWNGNYARSQNLFRSLVVNHYTPRPGGSLPVLPVAASPHGTPGMGFVQTDESNMIAFIDRNHQNNLPVDTIWLDAGWYNLNGHNDGSYENWNYVGTWDADPIRFPNGLKPVVDRAHSYGYKFLLWFEPERVSDGSWLAVNHPEWIIKTPSEATYRWLLNLGDPNALAWLKTKFSQMISDWGVDIYRQDFNMNTTLSMWRANDAADRQGMAEIKYIMGIYEFFDYLLQQHPNLLIDNCASGGRRLDFEMFKRSVSLTRSDWWWEPVGEQVMQYGLSYWTPWHGVGSTTADPYLWRSGMGGSFAAALNSLDSNTWAPAITLLNQYRSIQNTYAGEFYPLTNWSLANDVWMAWQNHVPASGQGSVQVFRRANCTETTVTVKFQGLDPNSTYTVTNLDGGSWNRSGDSLMNNGLPISIFTQPGAVVLKYSKN